MLLHYLVNKSSSFKKLFYSGSSDITIMLLRNVVKLVMSLLVVMLLPNTVSIATILLSPLFISELAVDSMQAALPFQLSSAFFVLASHAWAFIREIAKIRGIQYQFQFQIVCQSVGQLGRKNSPLFGGHRLGPRRL